MSVKKIKVLLVEDSPTMLMLLETLLKAEKDIEIVESVTDGRKVIPAVKNKKPDVLLMDCYLPGMNGIQITEKLMKENPLPIIIVSSFITDEEKSLVYKALEAGAIAALPKPGSVFQKDFQKLASDILRHVRVARDVRVVTRRPRNTKSWEKTATSPVVESETEQRLKKIKIIGIGASTGGPPVLSSIFKNLPKDFPVPIVVVQHIHENFADFMIQQFNRECKNVVKAGEEGEELRPGTIYFSPGRIHITVNRRMKIHLDDSPEVHSVKPAVDKLFHSMAPLGENVMGVLLTGMGKDGAEGLLEIKNQGGLTIAQSKESCAIFGMPGEAIKINAVDKVMDPEEIVEVLIKLYEINRSITA